jgi:hypothetical protein
MLAPGRLGLSVLETTTKQAVILLEMQFKVDHMTDRGLAAWMRTGTRPRAHGFGMFVQNVIHKLLGAVPVGKTLSTS